MIYETGFELKTYLDMLCSEIKISNRVRSEFEDMVKRGYSYDKTIRMLMRAYGVSL